MMHSPLNVKSYQMKGQLWNVIMYILFQSHRLPAKVMPSYSEHLYICLYFKKSYYASMVSSRTFTSSVPVLKVKIVLLMK